MKKYTTREKLQLISKSGKSTLSQVQIALLCGLQQGHISKIMRGIYNEENLSVKTERKINDLFKKIFK